MIKSSESSAMVCQWYFLSSYGENTPASVSGGSVQTREDYINEGMAGRTYDDKIRIVKDLYYVDNEAGMVNTVSQGKYKKYTFNKGYFSEQGKRLRAVYGMHSVSDNDISIILA